MKFEIDTAMWLDIRQIGLSIHGDLLKPNDIDIGISIKLPLFSFQGVRTFRLGKFNFIVFHNYSLDDYINEFDMDILRGWKSIWTRKLHLSWLSERALERKEIQQLPRDKTLFIKYEKVNLVARAIKYKNKLPEGWTFKPLETVAKKVEYQNA